jgi:hypothetical protein
MGRRVFMSGSCIFLYAACILTRAFCGSWRGSCSFMISMLTAQVVFQKVQTPAGVGIRILLSWPYLPS